MGSTVINHPLTFTLCGIFSVKSLKLVRNTQIYNTCFQNWCNVRKKIIHHLTTRQTSNRFQKECDVTTVASVNVVAIYVKLCVCHIDFLKKNSSEGFWCPRAACVNINNVDDTSETGQKRIKAEDLLLHWPHYESDPA